jgi:hypothetical protein
VGFPVHFADASATQRDHASLVGLMHPLQCQAVKFGVGIDGNIRDQQNVAADGNGPQDLVLEQSHRHWAPPLGAAAGRRRWAPPLGGAGATAGRHHRPAQAPHPGRFVAAPRGVGRNTPLGGREHAGMRRTMGLNNQ